MIKNKYFFSMLHVFFIEGVHGIGKSTLVNNLANMGFNILNEEFLELPEYGLGPNSMIKKFNWVNNMFDKILAFNEQRDKTKDEILIVDRSPYSTFVYLDMSYLPIKHLCDTMIYESTKAGIIYEIILLQGDLKVIYNHVLTRLTIETERDALSEGDFTYLVRISNTFNRLFNNRNVLKINVGRFESPKLLANNVRSIVVTTLYGHLNYKLNRANFNPIPWNLK